MRQKLDSASTAVATEVHSELATQLRSVGLVSGSSLLEQTSSSRVHSLSGIST